MLAVKMNRAQFEYDVHSLIKAFYPEEKIRVITPETAERKKREYEEDVRILIEFGGDETRLVLRGKDYRLAGKEPEAEEERRAYKDAFKRFLYKALCDATGKELPWGNLTGIRPTKIAMGLLEEGRKEQEILDYLRDRHFVSGKKAALSLDIAKRERELLSALHYENGYSLYIGIPFCPTTCLYCSFTSYPLCAYRDRVEAYIDCLIQEMEYVAQACRGRVLDTVYIGGGTPTTLEPAQLERLIGSMKRLFNLQTALEFTVEAGRADSITPEKLETLYRLGVTRISVNPQTMKQETLELIGRRHTVAQVEEAFGMARAAGFTNINMDLILGLPGENARDVSETLRRVKALGPDSLTVHSLAVKRASRLGEWIREHEGAAFCNTDETMELAAGTAESLGMKPYYLYRQKNMAGNFENVGYASEGRYGLYNILIMEEKQTIIALGAGSITKAVFPDGRIQRMDSVKDVDLYIERIDEMIGRKRLLLEEGKEFGASH